MEEKEERERKEREYKASICTDSMEKIIDESKEFRVDNDLRKLSKSQDFSQYLSEVRSIKIRLMNVGTNIKKILSEKEYEESYHDKHNEEF